MQTTTHRPYQVILHESRSQWSLQAGCWKMGKKSRKVKAPDVVTQQEEALQALRSKNSLLPYLRLQWTLAEKEEWWWIMDDSVAEIARQLKDRHFCVLDGFLGPERCARVEAEVKEAYVQGRLNERGHLAGGRTGQQATYTKEGVRDDWLGWVDGSREEGFEHLPQYMLKVQTLVCELKPHLSELEGVNSRARAMLTCYPGGGSRYIRHVDNGNRNGRKLTAILYLNPQWKEGDGGELRVFRGGDVESDEVAADVAPLGDRLLLFWADARVPHEVLPSHVARYAVTLWFFDTAERQLAEAAQQDASAVEAEEKRILDEMHKFKATTPHQQTEQEEKEGGETPTRDKAQEGPPTTPQQEHVHPRPPTRAPQQQEEEREAVREGETPTQDRAQEGRASTHGADRIDEKTRRDVQGGKSPDEDEGNGQAGLHDGIEGRGRESGGGGGGGESGAMEGRERKGKEEGKGEEGGTKEREEIELKGPEGWSLYVLPEEGGSGGGERRLVSSWSDGEASCAWIETAKGTERWRGVEVCIPSPVWLVSLSDVALEVGPTHLDLTWPQAPAEGQGHKASGESASACSQVPSEEQGQGQGEVHVHVAFPFRVDTEAVRARFRRREGVLKVTAPKLREEGR